MSTYTVIIFVALAALGALIAYLGDLLGAWLVRRRSSIWGLRPRSSARLMAALVGALLPLLGLCVATIGSGYARIAVFQLRSLLQRQEELTGQIVELEQQVAASEREAEIADQRAAAAEKKAVELESIQADQQQQIAELTARRDELRGRVAGLIARREQLQSELKDAQAALQSAEADLAAARSDLSTTREELAQKTAAVQEKARRVEQLRLQIENISPQIADIQGQLSEAQKELESRFRRLEEANQQLEAVQSQLEQVLRRQGLVATQRAVFEPGDELIRVVLSADETQDQMESDLYEILHLASALAERRGIPEGPNGRAVVVVAPIPRWAAASKVPESMIVRDVASQLRTRGPDEWVVMVRAFRRYFPEDRTQLAVKFEAVPNRLVFHAGDVLDEFTISADVSAVQAFEQLWLRIINQPTSRVRARAFTEGMLPHPETGNYGSIDLAKLFEAVEAIRAGRGMMRVRVVAAEDTYTPGPLLLDIQVAEADESS